MELCNEKKKLICPIYALYSNTILTSWAYETTIFCISQDQSRILRICLVDALKTHAYCLQVILKNIWGDTILLHFILK